VPERTVQHRYQHHWESSQHAEVYVYQLNYLLVTCPGTENQLFCDADLTSLILSHTDQLPALKT